MRRLNIIIPHLQDDGKLENTLVSVLQHRPAGCEVTVVHCGNYLDPYGLEKDEVCFIEAPPEAALLDLLSSAVARSTCEVVHFLEPGMEVVEGWQGPALQHFENPAVAAVAPLILDPDNDERVISAGLQFSRSGRRKMVRSGARYKPNRRFRANILGPHWSASFYRRSLIEQLLAGHQSVGRQLVDIDWALQLEAAAWQCKCEPRSHVRGIPDPCRFRSISDGRNLQRLFFRHGNRHGNWGFHAAAWMGDFLANLPRPAAIALPLGRLFACFEGRRHRRLRPIMEPAVSGYDEFRSDSARRRRHAA